MNFIKSRWKIITGGLIVIIAIIFSFLCKQVVITDPKELSKNYKDATYFGNEATGDLNGDGISDTAFIFTQSSSGTGTFYYVVVGLKTDKGYKGTNEVFLGDRIAPQTTEIKDGKLIVNYADRKPTDPMTTKPSVGVSKYFNVIGETLKEIK
jgi:hypothetical protein